MRNDNPSFTPSGKSTADPQRHDGQLLAKNTAQRAQNHAANMRSALGRSVATPEPRPTAGTTDPNRRFTAYFNAGNKAKQQPSSPVEYPQGEK